MTIPEHIEHLPRTDGGFTVRIERLGDDFRRTDALAEMVVAEALAREDAFAFMAAGGGRPHWEVIARSLWQDERDGESVLFPAHHHLRLLIGPVWIDQQRAGLDKRHSSPHEWVMPQLQETFDDLRSAPEKESCPPTPKEFGAAWKSTHGSYGPLHTAGTLLLSPSGDLLYSSLADEQRDPFYAGLAAARTRSTAPVLAAMILRVRSREGASDSAFRVQTPSRPFSTTASGDMKTAIIPITYEKG